MGAFWITKDATFFLFFFMWYVDNENSDKNLHWAHFRLSRMQILHVDNADSDQNHHVDTPI